MKASAIAVDALFEDPFLALDALWRAGGQGEGVPVRVRRRSPEPVVGFGDSRLRLDATLVDVRLSEVADPKKGDTVELLDEDGAPGELFEVIALGGIDSGRLVRACEVQLVLEEPAP